MQIHIGQEIQKVYKDRGWKIEYFAEKVNMTPRNASYLFNRKDISIEQLREISKALEHDFVKLFLLDSTTSLQSDDRHGNGREIRKDFMSFNIEVAVDMERIKEFPSFISKLRKAADEFGFILK